MFIRIRYKLYWFTSVIPKVCGTAPAAERFRGLWGFEFTVSLCLRIVYVCVCVCIHVCMGVLGMWRNELEGSNPKHFENHWFIVLLLWSLVCLLVIFTYLTLYGMLPQTSSSVRAHMWSFLQLFLSWSLVKLTHSMEPKLFPSNRYPEPMTVEWWIVTAV